MKYKANKTLEATTYVSTEQHKTFGYEKHASHARTSIPKTFKHASTLANPQRQEPQAHKYLSMRARPAHHARKCKTIQAYQD